MDIAVADATVRATREQAAAVARDDLREMSRRAVEAGRDRSRRIIKTSRIDSHTGELRYNPAGRLLRDWYFHIYLNTLRRNLGEPAGTIDAQLIAHVCQQAGTDVIVETPGGPDGQGADIAYLREQLG